MIAVASCPAVMPPSAVPRLSRVTGGIGSGRAASPTPIRTIPPLTLKCRTSNRSGFPPEEPADGPEPVPSKLRSRSPMLLERIRVS